MPCRKSSQAQAPRAHLQEFVQLLELVVFDRQLLHVLDGIGKDGRLIRLGLAAAGLDQLSELGEPAVTKTRDVPLAACKRRQEQVDAAEKWHEAEP